MRPRISRNVPRRVARRESRTMKNNVVSENNPWTARLPCAAAAALAPLRLQPSIEVRQEDAWLWLRGATLDEPLLSALRTVPGLELFFVVAGYSVRRADEHVPSAHFPDGDWTPLHHWLDPSIPAPAFGGKHPHPVALRLVASNGPVVPATVLEADLWAWHAYATGAPQARLEPLHFAASTVGRVVVHGRPLPPIRGRRFAELGGIAVPLGTAWSPPVDVEVMVALLGLEQGDLALLRADGTADHIRADHWMAATRAAVRATVAEEP